MMRDLARITDEIAAQVESRAGEMLHRLSPEGRRQRQRARARRRQHAARVARRLIAASIAILVAAVAWALIVAPLDITGAMLLGLTLAVSAIAILSLSRMPEPTPEALATSDLTMIPQRIEEWLERERPALPAPATRLVDGIGLKLEGLAPQLQGLDPREPVAVELRKLLCDDLTELVKGYGRVPEAFRRQSRDGPSPDRQLLDGLAVVDGELARLSEQLASGDLRRLATQGRYLEIKYKGDEELGG